MLVKGRHIQLIVAEVFGRLFYLLGPHYTWYHQDSEAVDESSWDGQGVEIGACSIFKKMLFAMLYDNRKEWVRVQKKLLLQNRHR